MTRGEALNKTIGILTYHQVNFCKSKEAVANMNEIIEALEKISQEPCDDCVSRQAVLDVLDKSKYSNEFCEEHHIDWSINLGMAHIVVNELKPVTLQPCDDAVSRQAVLDTIGNVPDHDDGMVWEALYHAQRDVALLSPVTAHQKMGHWVKVIEENGHAFYLCSVCKCGVEESFNWCPNCGSKNGGAE